MTNLPAGAYRTDDCQGDRHDLEKELNVSKDMGATVVSVMCLGQGQSPGHYHWVIVYFIPD